MEPGACADDYEVRYRYVRSDLTGTNCNKGVALSSGPELQTLEVRQLQSIFEMGTE
jgi:hypothetical protein